MLQLSRRSLLATTVAVGSLIALAGPSGAATVAPAATAPAAQAGVHRFGLGSFTVSAILDGQVKRPLDPAFVRNATLAEVQAALGEAGLPPDSVPISFTALLVDTGHQQVLIDTGFGNSGPAGTGHLLAGLATLGVTPAEIGTILISHFHGDHISGLRQRDGTLVFPNAQIQVPAAEWAYWTDEGEASRAPTALQANFALVRRVFDPIARQITRFTWGQEPVPGIRALDAHGHTPGHTVFELNSGGQSLLVLSDLTNVPFLFVRHPDWQVSFDLDGEQARLVRRRLLERAAAEQLLVAGYHFPFPAIGQIRREGDGYQLVPQG